MTKKGGYRRGKEKKATCPNKYKYKRVKTGV